MTPIRTTVAALAVVALPFAFAGSIAAAETGQSGHAANGEKIYVAQKCSICHLVNGKGGKMGPDLSETGSKRDAAWLKKYLADPKTVDPKNKMPAVKLKAPDMEDLVAYLLALKKAP